MAGPTEVTLMTGDPTHPSVTAYIGAWNYEAGIDPERGPWRDVEYHVFSDPIEETNAGHRADLFMDALMGISQSSAGLVLWTQAHRYPGNTRLVCRNVRKSHKGVAAPDTKLHGTNFAVVQAHYEVPAYPLSADDDPGGLSTFPGGPYPFVVTGVSRGFRDIDVPGVHKDGDADMVIPNFRVRIPEIVYKFRYVYLPSIGGAIAAISDVLHGKTNDATFLGRDPETLLFEAPESENRVSARGDLQSDMEFQMTWYPIGWNNDFFPGESAPAAVVLPDGTTKPYPTADFGVLLQYIP